MSKHRNWLEKCILGFYNDGDYKVISLFGIKIKIKLKRLILIKELEEQKQQLEQYLEITNKFRSYEIKSNSVLIVEPNGYHGEILPGFAKYFKDLGYNVDLFLRLENIIAEPFCRYQTNINIFAGTDKYIKQLLSLDKVKNYEYVFFSSSAYWTEFYADSYLNYLGFEPRGKNGLLLVEHNIEPYLKKYNEDIYLEQNRLFTISGFRNTPMLSPHFFGDVKITPKNSVSNFISVAHGTHYRNISLLLESAEKLIKDGIADFKITLVGKAFNYDWFEKNVDETIEKHIECKGMLSFSQLFDEIEEADFFLPLLDPSIEEHRKYKDGTTTGSRQLILCFQKPCLINDEFGHAYGFNDTNSILYMNNDLYGAMKQAISIKQEEYCSMQEKLKDFANYIYQKSLNNLKGAVGRI